MQVKVCGLTRQRDIDVCRELGADLAGFIFHPGSPRGLDPEVAARLKSPGLMRVGVFVRQSPQEAELIMRRCHLDMAQLHGGQDVDFCRRLGPERVIKVLWPERYQDPGGLSRDLRTFAPYCGCFLLDAGAFGGGHGRRMRAGLPDTSERRALGRPLFLAGGLGPDTIGSCLEREPDGVDLNSGVEASPGIKDREAIARTVAAIKGPGSG